MKENIFADLIEALRNEFLKNPVTRPAAIEWASQPGRSIEEIERSLMLEEMYGSDVAGR